jgi:O-antigen/teichoic acid export membrane protein
VNAARGIAYGLQGMTTRFSGGFMTAVVPQIIKSYANGDYNGMWRLVKRSSCFSVYLIWVLALPVWLEGDYVLKTWLGDYPEHALTFFHLIVIICLIDISRRAIINVIHATGHVFWENVIVGSILCLSFPFAYICLRLGYQPESVFWCTIASMVIGGIFEMFVLRHYHKYNIWRYVLEVYGRCVLVILVSSIIPSAIYSRYMEPCLLRIILTGVLTSFSIGVTALYLGMSRSDRLRLYEIFFNKAKTILGAGDEAIHHYN